MISHVFLPNFHLKKKMYFVISEKISDIPVNVAEALSVIDEIIEQSTDIDDLSLTTVVVVCKENTDQCFCETSFLNKILKQLRQLDTCAWPKNKTKDMNSQEFEFCWGGNVWFPILLHRLHNSKVRKSPHLMIAFQPGKVFDFNKLNRGSFYNKMRAAIHQKIAVVFNKNNRPFYLSEKSSGKNICQYSGIDKTEFNGNYIYPNIDEL